MLDPTVNNCSCAVILVRVVLKLSLLFFVLKQKAPIPRNEPGKTQHTHTLKN